MNRKRRFLNLLPLLGALLIPVLSHAGLVLERGMTEEKNIQPGQNYQGSIPIRNTGSAPVEIKVYQTDYTFSADGRNDYGSPGRLSRSNANWLSLNQEQVTIPAGGQVTIGYTLQVPNNASLIGTYWSIVMVEPIPTGSPESTAARPDEIRAQLTQLMRYGIQMVTHIADTGSRELVFENLNLLNKEGRRLLTVDLKNTGERWLRPKLSVELYDSNGQPLGKLNGQQQRLYPDSSARFQIELDKVTRGRYVALIMADGGGDDLFGTQVELNLR